MSVGAINIEVSANFARFAHDMGKVAEIAAEKAKEIDKVFNLVGTSLKALSSAAIVGLSLDSIKDKIEGAIAAAAGLKEIAEKTGSTVEGLSQIVVAAKIAGVQSDELAAGLERLAKAMVDAKDGGPKTGEALRAIGLSAKDLLGLKTDEAFKLIADRLNTFANSAEKTAVAQLLLGKSGANLLPTMKNLAEIGQFLSVTTAEQAEASSSLERHFSQLQAISNELYKTIAYEVVPVLDDLAKTFIESALHTKGLHGEINKLAQDKVLREWAEDAAKAIAFMVDAFDGVVRVVKVVGITIAGYFAIIDTVLNSSTRNMSRNLKATREGFQAEIDGVLEATLFSERLAARIKASKDSANDGSNYGHEGRGREGADIDYHPHKAGAGAKLHGDADAAAKRIYEAALVALDAYIKQEDRLLSNREKSIDFLLQQEIVSQRVALEQKQVLASAEIERVKSTYDKELQITDDRLKKLTASRAKLEGAGAKNEQDAQRIADLKDRTDAKIEEAQKKRAEIAVKRADAVAAATEKEVEAERGLFAITNDFNRATLEGERLAKVANDQQAFSIALLGQSTLAVQKATAARAIDVALQERIRVLKKQNGEGADTDAAIALATAAAEREKAAALDLVEQGYNKTRTAAFGANEAFRKYAEDASNTGAQIESALTNAFKGVEDALVEFTKTGKLNFKSLAESIISDIIRIQIRAALAKAALAASDILGQLFGFGGGGASDAATTGGATLTSNGFAGYANGLDYVPYDGFKAVLHKGEKVTPAYQLDAKQQSGGNVYITNNAPAQVSAQKDDSGDWQVLVEAAANAAHSRVAQDVSSGTGRVATAMKSRGLSLSGSIPRRS